MAQQGTAEMREQLAYACRILAREGLSDAIWGHVSFRNPGEESYWMKPAGFGFEEPTGAEMIRVSLDGEVLEGEQPRHIEYPIHSEVFRNRPEVTAVLHAHPEHSIAFGATPQRMVPVSHEGVLFCEPDIPRFDETSDLIRTAELGRAVARRMGEHRAMFLQNHGIVTAAGTLAEAVAYGVMLERAARIQLLASSAAREFASTSSAEIEPKRQHIYDRKALLHWWNYQCRQVGPLKRP